MIIIPIIPITRYQTKELNQIIYAIKTTVMITLGALPWEIGPCNRTQNLRIKRYQ